MKKVRTIIFSTLTLLLLPCLCWAASPTITSFSPTNHAAGTFQVVISGKNFVGTNSVRVYKAGTRRLVTNATFAVDSNTQITANVSLDAGSYYLRVQNGRYYANSPTLTVTAKSTVPVIDSISPTSHTAGTFDVVISGENFTGTSFVRIYKNDTKYLVTESGFSVNSDTQITANVSLDAGSYYLRLQNGNSYANSPTLTVSAPIPNISSISPDNHEAGTFPVVISGSNFDAVTAVSINNASTGLPVSNPTFTINSGTQITANADLATGSYFLKLTTAENTSNNSPALTVTAPIQPPSSSPPTPIGYKLKSTALVNLGTVSEGVTTVGSRIMWRDSANVVHLLATFSGDKNQKWFGHYLNTATGVHALITGTDGYASHPAYNPGSGCLYVGTSGTGAQGSLTEFDPRTQTLNVIKVGAPVGASCIDVKVGDDNRVYCVTNPPVSERGLRLVSYDPALGNPAGFKYYGTPYPTDEIYCALAVDSTHVYCGMKRADGTWTLVISPTSGSPSFTEWAFGSAGDQGIIVGKELGTGNWTCTRVLADGSRKVYYLHDGTYTDTGKSFIQGEWHLDRAPYYCAFASDESAYSLLTNTYNWDVDFTDLFPIKSIHEFSKVQYREVGAADWKTSTVSYTGPWYPQAVKCVAPEPTNQILGVTIGYNASVNLDPSSFSPAYLGANCFSPCEAMQHPNGEIYVGGYANKVVRYNPTLPWTLTSAQSTPKLPSDQTKPNPYFIQMTGDTYHYRHGLDYDINGIVWIGGNTTRGNPNYGNVMWYNPNDGSTGYLFPEWKTAGTCFRNLCAADNRRRICVSDNGGNIWIVDATTKMVDPVPITPLAGIATKTYMIEAENDIVFGIVIAPGPTYKVIRFRPSTKQILTLQDLGVSGTPFGFGDNQYDRMNYKLELGPDGYIWMFVGDSLYRVDPTTCAFTKVTDASCAKLKFSPNNVDLLLYLNNGTTDFKYIPDLLEPVYP